MACSEIFTRTLRSGERLFQNGELAEHAVVIRQGRVKLLLAGQIDIGTFGEGSILGLCETLACRTYQTDAIAAEDTIAGYLPQKMLLTMMLHDTKFSFEILEGVSDQLSGLIGKIQSHSLHQKHSRRTPPIQKTGSAA